MDEEPFFAEHIMKKLDECVRIDLNKTMLAITEVSSVNDDDETDFEQCKKEGCTNKARKGKGG